MDCLLDHLFLGRHRATSGYTIHTTRSPSFMATVGRVSLHGADLEQPPPVSSIQSRVSTPESACDSPVRLDCSSRSHIQETNTSPVDQIKISCALIGNNYCL